MAERRGERMNHESLTTEEMIGTLLLGSFDQIKDVPDFVVHEFSVYAFLASALRRLRFSKWESIWATRPLPCCRDGRSFRYLGLDAQQYVPGFERTSTIVIAIYLDRRCVDRQGLGRGTFGHGGRCVPSIPRRKT
jgi:hypothetical protein